MEDNLQTLLGELAQLRIYVEDVEAGLKPYKDAIANLNAAVLAKLNEAGITGSKSTDGHGVSIVKRDSIKMEDGEAFLNFVADQGDPSFLERRPSQEAVLKYLAEHDELPPGISMSSAQTLRFTRAKTKA